MPRPYADGQIQELGTYDELLRMGGGFAAAMSQAQADEEATDAEESSEEDVQGEAQEEGHGQRGDAVSGTAAAGAAAAGSGAVSGSSAGVGGVPPEQQPAPSLEVSPPASGPNSSISGADDGSTTPASRSAGQQSDLPPASAASSAGAPGDARLTIAPAAGSTAGAAAGRLTTEETRSQGAVSAAVIWAYVAAMGGPVAALLLMLGLAAVEVGRVGSRLWLQRWTTDVDTAGGGYLMLCRRR